MLIDKLKEWEYYYTKFPLYTRNSYGFTEQFKIIYDLMIRLEEVQKEILSLYDNFLNDSYVSNVIEKYDSKDNKSFSFLDMIANIYGLNRDIKVDITEDGKTSTKQLTLTNYELWSFIKTKIIQNNYNGTKEQSEKYYDNIDIPIIQTTYSNNPAYSSMYLDKNVKITDNLKYLFLSNNLTLKSMGISYFPYIVELTRLGLFAKSLDEVSTIQNTFNQAVFA